MKFLFLAVAIVALIWMGGCIGVAVHADYQYSNEIQSYWNLADKASTIQQKSAYLDQFVAALEHAKLSDYDAVILKTPDNNTAQNMVALKSLQGRMHEIVNMDPSSLQYQQAIAQITAQEQGEAKAMLDRFEGAWYLENHFLLWDWVGFVYGGFQCLLCIIGLGMFSFLD